MADNLTDLAGRDYISPDNKPATDGVAVRIPDGRGGFSDGTMRGGYVVPDPKN